MLSAWITSDFVRSIAVPVEPDQVFMHPMHEIGVDPAKYIPIVFSGGLTNNHIQSVPCSDNRICRLG